MKILLANDDGIEAYGLRRLAYGLKRCGHDIVVAAPAEERSATAHAITMGKNGLSYRREDFDGIEAYRIFGTPADCVKFGCLYLDLRPDFVIAGINHGHNIGSEVMYSGTVSAAYEGAYMGIRALAVSCGTHKDCALMDLASEFVETHLPEFAALDMPSFSILNINYPSAPAVGAVYTRMGVQLFDDKYLEEEKKFYLRGKQIGYRDNPEDCDVNWILKNYVTVTPLKTDRTDNEILQKLKAGRA